MSHYSDEFIKEMQIKLLAEKAKFETELQGLPPHTEMGGEAGEYDINAQEVELDEVNQDLIARIKQDLVKINTALGKIEHGTYGLDEAGKPISEDRLRVLPWADTSVS